MRIQSGHNSTVFLTGCTGFIGQYVLADLLQRGHRVIVLVRPPSHERIKSLSMTLNPLGVDITPYIDSDRLVFATGSLPDNLPEKFGDKTDLIIHAAACLQTRHDKHGEPFITNVEGLKAMTDWAQRHGTPRFCLISTAYVCGRDADIANEVFHTPQPRFETDYELSKWQAEQYLLEWANKSGIRWTILRPSLVIGDSRSGYTTQYGGFYQLARVIGLLRRYFQTDTDEEKLYLPLRIPADPDSVQNLVPVDAVSRAIAHIALQPQFDGSIYHLTNPAPPTNSQIKDWIENCFKVYGGRFVREIEVGSSESLAEDMFLKMSPEILQQMHYVPRFDCTNARKALRGSSAGILPLCPQSIQRMFDYAIQFQWGRHAIAS